LQEISTTAALREQLSEWRRSGDHIALVPTMGNLHDGHLSLVSVARSHAERVVVSVFVNPHNLQKAKILRTIHVRWSATSAGSNDCIQICCSLRI